MSWGFIMYFLINKKKKTTYTLQKTHELPAHRFLLTLVQIFNSPESASIRPFFPGTVTSPSHSFAMTFLHKLKTAWWNCRRKDVCRFSLLGAKLHLFTTWDEKWIVPVPEMSGIWKALNAEILNNSHSLYCNSSSGMLPSSPNAWACLKVEFNPMGVFPLMSVEAGSSLHC